MKYPHLGIKGDELWQPSDAFNVDFTKSLELFASVSSPVVDQDALKKLIQAMTIPKEYVTGPTEEPLKESVKQLDTALDLEIMKSLMDKKTTPQPEGDYYFDKTPVAIGQFLCPRCCVVRSFRAWMTKNVAVCDDCQRHCHVIRGKGAVASHWFGTHVAVAEVTSNLGSFVLAERIEPMEGVVADLPRLVRAATSPKAHLRVGELFAIQSPSGTYVYTGLVVSERREGSEVLLRLDVSAVVPFLKFVKWAELSTKGSLAKFP